jgi:hypothetical protein
MDFDNLTVGEKLELAENSNTSTETLTSLARDEYWKVRYYVTQNPNTPPEALTRLAEDEDWEVREEVAYNPNTPVETLACLADDKDPSVRWYIANNPNTPQYVKDYLNAMEFVAKYNDSHLYPWRLS